jgi:Domain of unknown function (DUF5615)
VLLDEQLPRQLARELIGHEIRTVQQQGWAGSKNGELLQRATHAGYEVFITADQNLEFQQNLARSSLFVLVLVAASNALRGSPSPRTADPRGHTERAAGQGGADQCLTPIEPTGLFSGARLARSCAGGSSACLACGMQSA